jgi:hypothetical protein
LAEISADEIVMLSRAPGLQAQKLAEVLDSW